MRRSSPITPERVLLVAMLMAAAIYLRDLSHDFILDDVPLIMMNPTITSWRHLKTIFLTDIFYSPYTPPVLSIHYRPLYMSWLMLNNLLFGMAFPWWHLTSLLLHLAVTVLVYQLAVRLLGDRWQACFAASLFVIHPLATESVAYVTASSDLLVALFSISAFLLYLRFREGERRIYWAASVMSAAAAMLCKETAAMFPWLLVTYESLKEKTDSEVRGWRQFVWTLPYFAVVVGYFAVRTLLFGLNAEPGPGGSRLAALLNIPLVILIYVKNLLIPRRLSFYYPTEWSTHWTLSRGLAIAVLATAAVWIWQRNQDRFRARVLLAWMGILLVPAALAVGAFVRDEWVHDRHVYFVAIPFCLLVSLLLAGVRPARRLALVESAIVLVLATGTFSQVPRFRDEISVYASALEVAPANTTLRRSYAVALWTQGRHQEALQQFQILISGEPGSPLWHELYAGALAEDGRKAEALESYSRALEKATGRTAHRAVILYRMGEIESEFSKLDLAETHLREAIGIDSQQMNYHGALAAVLRKQGNTREADEELQTEAANRNLYLSTHGPGARR